jgi:predicted transcriptional regulator
MSRQMIIRLDPEIKAKLSKLAKSEGKTVSQVIRELIQNYIQERDMGGYIDDLWLRMGNKLKTRGVKIADIEGAIRKARKAGNESSN